MKQKELAKSVGLNVAEGWVITVKNGNYTIPTELRYPCFLKPLATIVGGKRGLGKCENELTLQNVIRLHIRHNPDISILAEEYKSIKTEFALMGVSDGKKVIIPGVIKTLSLANGGHFGVAKQGCILPVRGYEGIVEKFKQFVLRTGFVGVFDIDFYESDGQYYFCETNFRYGGSGYAYTKMGVNLPDLMVRVLKGETLSCVDDSIEESAIFINERMCKDDWAEGYISTRQLSHLAKTSDISFIYDEEDNLPGEQYRKSIRSIELNVKRVAKRFLKRWSRFK